MKLVRKILKTKLDLILYIYIVISVILHLLYNNYLADIDFQYKIYYIDNPFYTVNNLLVLIFEFISKILNIEVVDIIEIVLNFSKQFSVSFFNFLNSIPYLNYLIEALNWVIMYILVGVLTLFIILKKFFEITIKLSLIVALCYVFYTLFYQYTISKQYQSVEYISNDLFNDCECEKVDVISIVDGDTIKIKYNGVEEVVRLLYIDTPEATKEVEKYGYEATNFLKAIINNAENVYLELDGENRDKYGRLLGWIWVDNTLVQEIMTKNGLVEDFYDYGDYKYEEIVVAAMKYAKNNQIKIYKN